MLDEAETLVSAIKSVKLKFTLHVQAIYTTLNSRAARARLRPYRKSGKWGDYSAESENSTGKAGRQQVRVRSVRCPRRISWQLVRQHASQVCPPSTSRAWLAVFVESNRLWGSYSFLRAESQWPKKTSFSPRSAVRKHLLLKNHLVWRTVRELTS